MKNFRRALTDTAHYWPRIALGLVCSAVAACLWGANIATLFPILEVTLRGESPASWNERRITEARQRIADLDRAIAATKADNADPAPPAAVGPGSIADLQIKRTTEMVQLNAGLKLQPWIARFAPRDPFRFLLLVVAWLLVASLIRQSLQTFANVNVARVSQDVTRNIRHRIFDKTLEMDRGAFLAHGPSGFAVQILQGCEMLAAGIQSVFGGACSEPLRLVACAIGAAMISWRLLLASLLFTPLATFAIIWLNRRLRSVARHTLDRSHGLYHVMHEALQNMATVQAFCMEDQERTRFRQATRQMRRLAIRSAFYSNLVSPVTEVLGLSVLCMSITLGAHMLLHQQATVLGMRLLDRPLGVSELMVFFGMLLGATDPIRRLSGVATGINQGMMAADALYGLLDRASLIADPAEPRSPARPHGELKLTHVTFGYQAQRPVLKDFTLSIPFGETVAVVGANGTGKSTLVNLLCRFYDPQRGSIKLDDVSLPQMTRKELRSRIALVTQQTELFNESLQYNIRYGRPDATDDEVIRAATLSRAHEFIVNLPEQYQTIAGPNGLRLSGGQRQRIALARALLRDPEILILDEATSQIDVESEQLVHEALRSFRGTRTIILITHRQSVLALADRIIRVHEGGVVEEPASGQPHRAAA